MLQLLLIIAAIAGLLVTMRREAGALPALSVLAVAGVIGVLFGALLLGTLLLLGAAGVAICGLPALRRKWLTPRVFSAFKKAAPKVSDTERAALEAGTVAWDGELVTGKPTWSKLLDYAN